MTREIEYIGEIDNWMDFRDILVAMLQDCDTEIKFNNILAGIITSIGVSPESMQEARIKLGMKKFSKKEMKRMENFFKDDRKNI